MATVPVDDMLDNGKAQPGATHLARPVRIDAVEPFGQPRDVVRGDPVALVGDADLHALPAQPQMVGWFMQRDDQFLARAAIFDAILDQVGKDLRQLPRIAWHAHHIARKVQPDCDIGGGGLRFQPH